MPYISEKDREKYIEIKKVIDSISEITTKGDLEYLTFLLMKKYMSTREARYTTLHDTVYAIMHCADEFRRRYLDKRENAALEQNGDI